MFIDNAPHVPGPNDRTIIKCPTCGWVSIELTRDQLEDLGLPRYCGARYCNGLASQFVTFAPHERAEALDVINSRMTDAELKEHQDMAKRNRDQLDAVQLAAEQALEYFKR